MSSLASSGPLVLGIDSSTQSCKVELRSIETGALVATGRSRHPATTPPRSEQDPASWWQALQEALQEALAQVPSTNLVAASVAGQQHGLVLLDDQGEAIRPAKLWNDTESAPQADALVSRRGPEAWAESCGSVPGPSFTVTKLAWVAEHEPEQLDRVARVMLPHDYLTWRLTGEHVTDRGDASGTGWFDPSSNLYLTDHLHGLTTANLPRVLDPTAVAGVWERSGASITVGPGTGDNMAAALGLGLRGGDLAMSLGTSGTAYAVSGTPTRDASGQVAGFADATGNYLPLVCTLNAMKVIDTVSRLLGADHDTFDALALGGTSGDLAVVPYFDGERTPNLPNASGWVLGLRTDASRESLARSTVEGVCCGLLEGVDALGTAGVDITRSGGRAFLIGGGARSPAVCQIMADLAQRELIVPDADETVATGACVQAAVVAGAGSFEEVASRWQLGAGSMIRPDDASAAADEAARIRARHRSAASLQAT